MEDAAGDPELPAISDSHCRERARPRPEPDIYYVLTRIKGICKVYLDRQRMAEVA
jgi:hypothetical protein